MSDDFKFASLGVCVPDQARDGIEHLRQRIAEIPGVLSIESDGYGFALKVAMKAVGEIRHKIGAIEQLKTPTGFVIVIEWIDAEPWHRLQSHEVH